MMTIKKNTDLGLLILRFLVAGLLLFHGIGNLMNGYEFIKSMVAQAGLPTFVSYGAFFGEIVAPALILIGYEIRIAALLVAFNMLTAILTTHADEIFALNQFGGWAIELQAFYLFGAIVILLTGGGKYVLG